MDQPAIQPLEKDVAVWVEFSQSCCVSLIPDWGKDFYEWLLSIAAGR